MHFMTRVVLGICIFLSMVIIFCVAMQSTKSEGLSGSIGGSRGSSFKGSRQDEFLAKITRYTGVAWILGHVVLAYMWVHLR
ncbi:MAG: preprotein translocase subunit SecG [Armatimonadia bacterium]|nr:preprotein translocase subunit SecG [Armatimonadia bacterium]